MGISYDLAFVIVSLYNKQVEIVPGLIKVFISIDSIVNI